MKNLSRKILFMLCLLPALLSAEGAAAQESRNIVGRLVDAADGKALAYATVVALDKNGEQAASAITYPDGRFSVSLPRRGDYQLWFSFVGYQSLSKKIAFDNSGQDLGKIALKAGVEVQGVEIKARQLVRRETDRLVYDVASDPDARRMRMMEIMGKIPELEMNAGNGKLQYENTPVTQIYIDNRENGMINAKRQYPMNFIQASYMSKIELVLPGSPEYNNTEPILLIELAAPLPYGFAGQLSANASTRGEYAAGANAVANTPWTGIGVNYNFGYTDAPRNARSAERLQNAGQYADLVEQLHEPQPGHEPVPDAVRRKGRSQPGRLHRQKRIGYLQRLPLPDTGCRRRGGSGHEQHDTRAR